MSIVDRQSDKIINQLLHAWPRGVVAVPSWLASQGVSRKLAAVYLRGQWIRRVGHGAYARADGKVDWTGALFALQRQLGLAVHVGGKTALARKGLAHFLPVGKQEEVTLVGNASTRLPRWFSQYDWGARIEYVRSSLFEDPLHELALTEDDCGDYSIVMASPERAILEVLDRVPQAESFEGAKLLMENLTALRPKLVQELLERCTSVKAKRLFLFLAEECGHAWVREIKKERVDLGKGKRVVVTGGRLDPVYQITVPREAFADDARLEQVFLNQRSRSPALRLMVPQSTKLSFGKEDACFASVAYMAFVGGLLPRLDALVKKFRIEEKGDKHFKKELNENWLDEVGKRKTKAVHKIAKNTTAAIAELVVAEHLQQDGYRLLELEAWEKPVSRKHDKPPDILCSKDGHKWAIEVKYLGVPPDLQEMIDRQLTTGEKSGLWGDERASANYFFGRIAEAILQLEKAGCPLESRQVWLVFSPLSGQKWFEKYYLATMKSWYEESEQQKVALKCFNKGIVETKPSEWRARAGRIVLATMKDWRLEDVVSYDTAMRAS